MKGRKIVYTLFIRLYNTRQERLIQISVAEINFMGIYDIFLYTIGIACAKKLVSEMWNDCWLK